MAAFDSARKSRIASAQPINYNDPFVLKFVGNKWGTPPPDVLDFLGGPTTYMNYWYPIAKRARKDAIVFSFEASDHKRSEVLKSGKPLDLRVHEGTAKNYYLRVPSSPNMMANTVYLTDEYDPTYSRWFVYLVNDRVDDAPIYYDDEIYLFSYTYHTQKSSHGMTGYDPWQRLTMDPYNQDAPDAKRWTKYQGGKWDIWRIVKP
jgi:hypothetical protein